MQNKAMERKLRAGECLDVEKVGQLAAHDGWAVYRLDTCEGDMDYCVGSTEQWIWSIGRRHSDGAILASTDNRLYQHPAFECLWLR